MARKTGLGRGLAALIPEAAPPDERIPVSEVEIGLVAPNPHQPRTSIDSTDLETLTASVKQHGIIQPLLVSEAPDGATGYTLIAGERRLRAARAAGLTRVPVTIRQSTPQELLELALIENLQRLDLSALEEAAAYRGLIDQFALTQQQVADRVGRSRTAIANTLRLLDLSDQEQASLSAGELSEGHARALLGIDDPAARRTAWRDAIARGLNVRQTEALVRRWPDGSASPDSPARPQDDPETAALESKLRAAVGTKVELRRRSTGRGRLVLHFYSDDELTGLLARLGVEMD